MTLASIVEIMFVVAGYLFAKCAIENDAFKLYC